MEHVIRRSSIRLVSDLIVLVIIFCSLSASVNAFTERTLWKAKADSAKANGHYHEALLLLDSVIEDANIEADLNVVASTFIDKALIYQIRSEHDDALAMLFKAQSVYIALQDDVGLAQVFNNIGSIHYEQKELTKAAQFYEKSLAIYERLSMKKEIARGHNNFGSLFEEMNSPMLALDHHKKALAIWKEMKNTGWEGVCYMHFGVCYELLGKLDSAVFYLERSVELLEETESRFQLSLIYGLLGNVHRQAGRGYEALRWCEMGLHIAEDLGVLRFQLTACECLYNVHEDLGQFPQALKYHKLYIQIRDSVFNKLKIKEAMRVEMDHSFAQKSLADSLQQEEEKLKVEMVHQTEVANKEKSRNIFMGGGILFLLLAVGFFSRWRYVKKSRDTISKEKDRSEDLLLNILPAEIAEELKEKGEAAAREFEMVSILFTDFKGFTQASEKLSAADLVAEINVCFKAFDGIVGKYNIEKIKTIGDAYMCAGGLPIPDENAVINTVKAGLEMQNFIRARKTERDAAGLPAFEMRAGIHTGPVVAGIVGVKKFQYDIWGDTVNTASRMESSGEVGQVNISEATYELVKDDQKFKFTSRGSIEAKGKGHLEMYFVHQ